LEHRDWTLESAIQELGKLLMLMFLHYSSFSSPIKYLPPIATIDCGDILVCSSTFLAALDWQQHVDIADLLASIAEPYGWTLNPVMILNRVFHLFEGIDWLTPRGPAGCSWMTTIRGDHASKSHTGHENGKNQQLIGGYRTFEPHSMSGICECDE